jgi:hypothetical protein
MAGIVKVAVALPVLFYPANHKAVLTEMMLSGYNSQN